MYTLDTKCTGDIGKLAVRRIVRRKHETSALSSARRETMALKYRDCKEILRRLKELDLYEEKSYSS
jgi:hypothetical protein